MSVSTTLHFYSLRLDKNGMEETFILELVNNPVNCERIGPFGLKICRLTGELRKASTGERYTVTGTRFYTAPLNAISLNFRFRRVRITASGVMLTEFDFATRFVAHGQNNLFESSLPPRVDPDVGDTGTGTGTQTFVEDEGNQSDSTERDTDLKSYL